jgi:hypothetical protein
MKELSIFTAPNLHSQKKSIQANINPDKKRPTSLPK